MLKHCVPAFQCILVSRSSLRVFSFQRTEIYLLLNELGFLGVKEELRPSLNFCKFAVIWPTRKNRRDSIFFFPQFPIYFFFPQGSTWFCPLRLLY